MAIAPCWAARLRTMAVGNLINGKSGLNNRWRSIDTLKYEELLIMSAKKPQVLDVGQCDFDHETISRMLSEEFGAGAKRAATYEEAVRAVRAGHYDLVLVNRVLDADGASGLDLMQRLLSNEITRTTPTMLVSNYADAQDAAVALGATRGFGKNTLTNPETRDLLAPLLDRQKQP